MQKSELKFKKLILKLTNTNSFFFNRLRWKKVLTLLSDDPALGVFLAPIATNSENIYSVKAQDIIARAWWNSIGDVEEKDRFSLLVATRSHAEAGSLRIYTHVIHNDLEVLLASHNTFDNKNSFKGSSAMKLLEDLEAVISLGDNWSLELISQIGVIAVTKKFGDSLPDLLWKHYFDESKYADEIRVICERNSILPSAGNYYFTSAAILGPAFFRRLITVANIDVAYSEVSRCLEKFYSFTIYSENRRVGSEFLKKSISDLIEHAEGEILEYFNQKKQEYRKADFANWVIDPGFGFGKTTDHNFQLLNQLQKFRQFNKPLLVGISRKGMIWKTINGTPETALNGTTALHMAALDRGANILRVHDVKEAKECIDLFLALKA